MSRYELRILQGSWGLWVNLDLSVHDADLSPVGAVQVAPRTWLLTTGWVHELDLQDVIDGVQRVAPRFHERLEPGRELVFVLEGLEYPPTDWQEGATELAVLGWAAEKLELPDDPATVSFDRAANRYVIELDETLWDRGRA